MDVVAREEHGRLVTLRRTAGLAAAISLLVGPATAAAHSTSAVKAKQTVVRHAKAKRLPAFSATSRADVTRVSASCRVLSGPRGHRHRAACRYGISVVDYENDVAVAQRHCADRSVLVTMSRRGRLAVAARTSKPSCRLVQTLPASPPSNAPLPSGPSAPPDALPPTQGLPGPVGGPSPQAQAQARRARTAARAAGIVGRQSMRYAADACMTPHFITYGSWSGWWSVCWWSVGLPGASPGIFASYYYEHYYWSPAARQWYYWFSFQN
jgi:hypothetical protein